MIRYRFTYLAVAFFFLFSTAALAQKGNKGRMTNPSAGKRVPCPECPCEAHVWEVLAQLAEDQAKVSGPGGTIMFDLESNELPILERTLTTKKGTPITAESTAYDEAVLLGLFSGKKLKPFRGTIVLPGEEDALGAVGRTLLDEPLFSRIGTFKPSTTDAEELAGDLHIAIFTGDYFAELVGTLTKSDDGDEFDGNLRIDVLATGHSYTAPVTGDVELGDWIPVDETAQATPPVDDGSTGDSPELAKLKELQKELEDDYPTAGDPIGFTLLDIQPLDNAELEELFMKRPFSGSVSGFPGRAEMIDPFASGAGILELLEDGADPRDAEVRIGADTDDGYVELAGTIIKDDASGKRLFDGTLTLTPLDGSDPITSPVTGVIAFTDEEDDAGDLTADGLTNTGTTGHTGKTGGKKRKRSEPTSDEQKKWDDTYADLFEDTSALPTEGTTPTKFAISPNEAIDDSELQKIFGDKPFAGEIFLPKDGSIGDLLRAKQKNPFSSGAGTFDPDSTPPEGWEGKLHTIQKTADGYIELKGTIELDPADATKYRFDGDVRALKNGEISSAPLVGTITFGDAAQEEEIDPDLTVLRKKTGETGNTKQPTGYAMSGSARPVKATSAGAAPGMGPGACGTIAVGDGLWVLLFSLPFFRRRRKSNSLPI